MHLVDEDRQKEILNYFKNAMPIFHPGGSAPNTLIACAGLGITGVISGKIGNDALAKFINLKSKNTVLSLDWF